MAKSIVAVFKRKQDAEDALNELNTLGYDPKSISVVMRQLEESENTNMRGENMAAGAASGAGTGAIVGGIAGLLVGIGALAIPGFGAVLVGGPIAAALGLTGAAATTTTGALTGALAGGVVGALVGLGVPEEQARQYDEIIKAGGVLLAVPVLDRRTGEVEDVLNNCNAFDVRQLNIPDEHQPTRERVDHTEKNVSYS